MEQGTTQNRLNVTSLLEFFFSKINLLLGVDAMNRKVKCTMNRKVKCTHIDQGTTRNRVFTVMSFKTNSLLGVIERKRKVNYCYIEQGNLRNNFIFLFGNNVLVNEFSFGGGWNELQNRI